MLDSFIVFISQGAELGSAASHTPQAAVAAVLCAALVGLLSCELKKQPHQRLFFHPQITRENCCMRAFCRRYAVKAHADIADQQTPFRRDADALLVPLHQPIAFKRRQQLQVFGEVSGKVDAVLPFERLIRQPEVADQGFNHIAPDTVVAR